MTTDQVQIGGPTGSLTFARLDARTAPARGVACTLEFPGLRASEEVELPDWDGEPGRLASFFNDLAGSWRGWEGAREWRGRAGELRLTATHDGIGHILLIVTMSGHWRGSGGFPDEWTASGALALEPGSLEETARRVNDVLSATLK